MRFSFREGIIVWASVAREKSFDLCPCQVTIESLLDETHDHTHVWKGIDTCEYINRRIKKEWSGWLSEEDDLSERLSVRVCVKTAFASRKTLCFQLSH